LPVTLRLARLLVGLSPYFIIKVRGIFGGIDRLGLLLAGYFELEPRSSRVMSSAPAGKKFLGTPQRTGHAGKISEIAAGGPYLGGGFDRPGKCGRRLAKVPAGAARAALFRHRAGIP